MKDDEIQPIPLPQPQTPSIAEAHPENAEHSSHHYDAIDQEFYTEGAGDA